MSGNRDVGLERPFYLFIGLITGALYGMAFNLGRIGSVLAKIAEGCK